MKEYYKHIKFDKWSEYKELAEKSRLEWIFRGQSNSNWELRTTLERSNIIENFPEFEDELLNEFKKGAKFYLKEESEPETTLEYLSMLQHYGAPSRLLDFSKSPYVAAYFAFEQATENTEEVAIWVVNKISLYQRSIYYFENKISHLGRRKNYTFDDITFEQVFEESKKGEFNCLFPTEPNNQNQRHHLQQSIFLAQGNPYQPLVEQLEFIDSDNLNETFMKVTLPTTEKKCALREMQKMNINRATLFPGLDGYAKSLLLKYSNLSTFGETYEFLEYAKNKNMA